MYFASMKNDAQRRTTSAKQDAGKNKKNGEIDIPCLHALKKKCEINR